MFNYDQSLPGLDQLCKKPPDSSSLAGNRSKINNNIINNSKWQEQAVQTDPSRPPPAQKQTNSTLSSSSGSSASSVSSSTTSSANSTRATNHNHLASLSSWPSLPANEQAVEPPHHHHHQHHQRNGCILLLNSLPQVVNNSALVRQRASAKDSLAAASLNAGASVPLMAGSGQMQVAAAVMTRCHLPDCPNAKLVAISGGSDIKTADNSSEQPPAPTQTIQQQPASKTVVPKNTALRAEQRKQNMVSVVRPVVSTANAHHIDGGNVDPIRAMRVRLEDSPIWSQQQQQHQYQHKQTTGCNSVLEDFMKLDRQISQTQQQLSSPLDRLYSTAATTTTANCDRNLKLDQLILSPDHFLPGQTNNNNNINIDRVNLYDDNQYGKHALDQFGEQQARQQAAHFRREEFELNRAIRRQHRFLLAKLEERKRGLQIVQAVWFQKGFKEAIERLVDIYHQGLIFTTDSTTGCDLDNHLLFDMPSAAVGGHRQQSSRSNKPTSRDQQQQQGGPATLSSLNTSLVVDVLGIIILRPKLWNLEICQLLLPIINNDLMMQAKQGYENYLEVALKAIKLILTHFSAVIITTLDGHRKDGCGGQAKTLVGVDLSREDRLNKCLNCWKLLLESRSIIRLMRRHHQQQVASNNLATAAAQGDRSSLNLIHRELEQLFATFESSLDPGQIGPSNGRAN